MPFRSPGGPDAEGDGEASRSVGGEWTRHEVGRGIELHLRADRPPLNEEELEGVIESLRIALKEDRDRR